MKKVDDTGMRLEQPHGLQPAQANKGNAGDSEKFYNEHCGSIRSTRGRSNTGELYLMTGNLPMAEQRLAALDKACFLPCSEHSDLKKAVARYKSNGNKYIGDW